MIRCSFFLGALAILAPPASAQGDPELLRRAKAQSATARAQIEFRLGNHDAALEAVEDAARLVRDPFVELFRIGILVRAGRFEEAMGALDEYAERHGPDVERILTLRTVFDGLDRAPEPAEARRRAEHLIEAVKHLRNEGRPARMIPLLMQSERLVPGDWRVTYSLGEAFGVGSPLFDPLLARLHFQKLLSGMPLPGEPPATGQEEKLRRLAVFLEVEPDEGMLTRLRSKLIGHQDTLERLEPIAVWGSSRRRLEDEFERLISARARGDWHVYLDLALEARDRNPMDPLAHFMVGEALGSLNPFYERTGHKRDAKELAVESFERFLEHSRISEKPGQAAGRLTRGDLAALLSALLEIDPGDDLQSIRLEVREWISYLEQDASKASNWTVSQLWKWHNGRDGYRGRRPHYLLLAPDRRMVKQRLAKLERAVAKEEYELARQRAELAEDEAKLRYWEALLWEYESRRTRGNYSEPPQRIRDNITTCRRNIVRHEKGITDCELNLSEWRSELEPLQRRLAQFGF